MTRKLHIGYSYLFLLVGFILLHSCSDMPSVREIRSAEKRYERSTDPQEKSELANTLHRLYSLYYVDDPVDTLFLRQWAGMAVSGQEYEESARIYSMMLERGISGAYIYGEYGKILARLGYFAEAGEVFTKAGEQSADAAQADQYRELCAFYAKTDSILHLCSEMIRKDDAPEDFLLKRSRQLLLCRHYSAAASDANRILASDSLNVPSVLLLARIHLESGNTPEAHESLRMITPENINDERVYQEYTLLLRKADLYAEAEELVGELVRNPTSYDRLVKLTAVYFELKDYQSASGYANAMIQYHPDSIRGYLYRGQLLIQTGDPALAISDFNQAIRLQPDNISARNLKAYCYLLQGETDKLRSEVDIIESLGGEVLEVLKPYGIE